MSVLVTKKSTPPQTFRKAILMVFDIPTAGNTLPEKLPGTPVCLSGMTIMRELPSHSLEEEYGYTPRKLLPLPDIEMEPPNSTVAAMELFFDTNLLPPAIPLP